MSPYPEARFLGSAHRIDQLLPDEGAEVAFAGRSNAGKSSAINAIVGRRDFARTSKTPGRTQLINFFEAETGRRLVDLPGYGYAKVSKEMREHWGVVLDRYFRIRRSLAGLVLIVDSRRGIGDYDRQMLDWARATRRPVLVLLTKADKLSRAEARTALAEAEAELGRTADEKNAGAVVRLFSSPLGTGVAEARRWLNERLGAAGSGA